MLTFVCSHSMKTVCMGREPARRLLEQSTGPRNVLGAHTSVIIAFGTRRCGLPELRRK